MGHLVVAKCAELAVEMARENGVAWVGCNMSGHAGAAGVYAALPLKHDMIGIYAAVANANHMPLAAAPSRCSAPTRWRWRFPPARNRRWCSISPPSIVSYGTIKNHKMLKQPLHDDWMIDPKTARPSSIPKRARGALLLPMAGYKGVGSGADVRYARRHTLNGALFGRDCVDFNVDPATPTNTGQFVLALDPARFQPLAKFKAEVDRHIRSLRNSKALPGNEAVRLPGDQRAKRRADPLGQRPGVARRIAGATRQARRRTVDQAAGGALRYRARP